MIPDNDYQHAVHLHETRIATHLELARLYRDRPRVGTRSRLATLLRRLADRVDTRCPCPTVQTLTLRP